MDKMKLSARTFVLPAMRILSVGAVLLIAVAAVDAAPQASAPAIPPDKQAILDHYAAMRSHGLAHPAPKVRPAVQASSVGAINTPAPRGNPVGAGYLVDTADTMRPAGDSVNSFTDSWYTVRSDLNVDVWAGAHGSDPSQGFLLVDSWDAGRVSLKAEGVFDTPDRSGIVRITGATGTVLTISTAGGRTYTFDVLTHTFR